MHKTLQNIEAEVRTKIQNEKHRFAHTNNHVDAVYWRLQKTPFNLLFALFHDSVYYPWRDDNEEKSVEYMKDVLSGSEFENLIPELEKAIMATKYDFENIDFKSPLVRADLLAFFGDSYANEESEYEMFKEYQFVDFDEYESKRADVLYSFLKQFKRIGSDTQNIEDRLKWLSHFQPKIGVFAGSFNPFHIGHMNILEKAEKVFDKVIVAQGVNTEKNEHGNLEDIRGAVVYREVTSYTGLLTEFLNRYFNDATLVRGLRNGNDLAYEQNLSEVLRDVQGDPLNVAYFLADREYAHISSSVCRELKKLGKPDKYTKFAI